jgi:DNA-binding transcriptional LysR family regulator
MYFSSSLVNLRRDDYDVALRATSRLEPGLVARTIARSSVIAVASPEYLAAHGTPKSLKDLRLHRCLMGFARGELPETHVAAGGRKMVLEGAFFSNNPQLLCRLAARGAGIAFVPALLAREGLGGGELVQVMPSVLRSESRIAIVHAEREFVPPQVRAFVDWMVERVPAAFLNPTS